MEKRSVDIYRPPQELITKADKTKVPDMKKMLELNNCVLQSSCLNLEVFDDPIAQLQKLSETIGHELVKIQSTVANTISDLEKTTNPVATDISYRRNDIQSLRSSLEQKLDNFSRLRDNLMQLSEEAMGSQKETRDLARITQNVDSAQRILTVGLLLNVACINMCFFLLATSTGPEDTCASS